MRELSVLFRSGCFRIVVDQCLFGARWRKRTALLFGNVARDDVECLNLMCRGRGICDRTKRPHFNLEGGGRTRLAKTYPPRFCHTLIRALTAEVRATAYNTESVYAHL